MNIETKLNLYRMMTLIRTVEEEISKRYSEGKMRCPTHLSIGQEAAAGVFSLLARKKDFCVSAHRGHAHYLAKGGDVVEMISEIYGKATGCSRGKGGSMHLVDLSVNFMGTSAIVGNSIPVGVGLGLAAQFLKTEGVSFVFLGDGAVEEGVFYESVNFAALRKLPVVFICENNLYSVYSGLKVRQPAGRSIAGMVAAMGINSAACSADNLDDVYFSMESAIERARSGQGAQFLEIATYRWLEHCGPNSDNHIGYRSEKEFEEYFSRDPLRRLENDLNYTGPEVAENIRIIKLDNLKRVDDAFTRAEAAPFPDQAEAYRGIYA
jgi:TPP-dependent pyruvate/acetoin dehydrogenase alpha subunit